MSFEKWRKRKVFPITLDGETHHIRSWSLADSLGMGAHKTEAGRADYIIRISLCDADGNLLLQPDESAADFDKAIGEQIVLESLRVNGFQSGSVESAKKD